MDRRIRGGDRGLYYTGSDRTERSKLDGTSRTASHTEHPSLVSVGGMNQAAVHLHGTWSGDAADLEVKAAEAPEVDFTMQLERLAD